MKKAIMRIIKSAEWLLAKIGKLEVNPKLHVSIVLLSTGALIAIGYSYKTHIYDDGSWPDRENLTVQLLDQKLKEVKVNYSIADKYNETCASQNTVYILLPRQSQCKEPIIKKQVKPYQVFLDNHSKKHLPDYPLLYQQLNLHHQLSLPYKIERLIRKSGANLQQIKSALTFEHLMGKFNQQLDIVSYGEELDYNVLSYFLLRNIIIKVTELLCEDHVEMAQLQPLELSHMQQNDHIQVNTGSMVGYKH
jgi:hypothetical protein